MKGIGAMTLEHSTGRIHSLDPEDLTHAVIVVAERARAVVEFAAGSNLQTLEDAHAAGQFLIQQLLEERNRLIAEIRNSRSLHDSLALTVSSGETGSIRFG